MNIDLTKLSRELAEHGQIIESGWQALRMITLGPAVPESRVEEMRVFFFSGASHLLAALLPMLQISALQPADYQRLVQIHAEIDRFIEQLELRQMPVRGRA